MDASICEELTTITDNFWTYFQEASPNERSFNFMSLTLQVYDNIFKYAKSFPYFFAKKL